MGIFIFKREKLFKYLKEDAKDKNSNNDFGKNIIPNMLNKHEKMMAYPFKGYWKDVGTIKSLWEANQDLLGENPAFDIYDSYWKIYSRNMGIEPQYIASGAKVEESLITSGAKIYGTVINSIIGSNVVVGKDAIVRDSVIFANTIIEDGAVVDYSIIDENVHIGARSLIGAPKANNVDITVIGRNYDVISETIVPQGENLEDESEVK